MKLRFLLLPLLVGLLVSACGGGTQPTAAPTNTVKATVGAGTTVAPTATPRPTTPPPASPTTIPVPTGEIKIALSTLSNFNTLEGFGGVARSYLDAMYDYVIGEKDGKLDFKSGFATDWSLSPDGKSHTLKFRDNIVYQDGTKPTSSDVIWYIEYAKGNNGNPTAAASAAPLKAEIASMTTPDDYTLVVQLTGPQIFWPIARLSRLINGSVPSYLFPGKYVDKVGVDTARKAPIGSGPFKFKSIAVTQNIIFEATERNWYWGVPKVKTMEYDLIPEESTRVALLQSGGADLVGISRTPVQIVRSDSKLTLFQRENSGIVAYKMEEESMPSYPGYGPNPLADLRVRQAMDRYSIDRKVLVDNFLKGLGTPTFDYPVTVAETAWQKLPDPPKRDVAQAKKLLADAGFPNGFALDMYVWGGLQPPEGPEMMEAVAVWWEEIGIKVNRKPIAFTSYSTARPVGTNFSKPSVAGVWFLGNNPVASSSASTAHDPNVITVVNKDPQLAALGKAWAFSSTEADYIKNGRAYQQAIYDAVGASGGGNALMYVGDLFAGNAKIPKNWNLGRAQYSFQIEQVGLRI